jgi:hypothetical protein
MKHFNIKINYFNDCNLFQQSPFISKPEFGDSLSPPNKKEQKKIKIMY